MKLLPEDSRKSQGKLQEGCHDNTYSLVGQPVKNLKLQLKEPEQQWIILKTISGSCQ
jgi:hypothetical protein